MNQIRHFDMELGELRRSMVTMGNLVDRALGISIEAINAPTVGAREQVRGIEDQLDAMETAIEDRAHQIMALQHPIARDLRLVISSMRISSDLEQVGDLAESVAKRASWIARNQGADNPAELASLGVIVQSMVRRSMDSFVTGAIATAKQVISDEDEADRLTKCCYERIQESMRSQNDRIREYTHLLRAVSHLEQIADIAVSIAEEAVFIHQGIFVRHQHHDFLER